MSFQEINQLAGIAVVNGYAHEVVALNEVLAFDLRFNLHHPKMAAIYMLETPINGCHFEVVRRDGRRYHIGDDIAARILGEEKSYMATIEQMATMAKEQQGLVKKFTRKCDMFSRLFPEEAKEEMLKARQKEMEEQYIDQAGGVLSRLSQANTALPTEPVSPLAEGAIPVEVSSRIRTKLRTNCEIQYALAQSSLPSWVEFLESKREQVLGSTDVWSEIDPTGTMKLFARDGKIFLNREGEIVGTWDSYGEAHSFLRLGTNSLPNPVLPLTLQAYERTIASIPVDKEILKKAILAQVTPILCDSKLWDFLNA
jgi:hypothetical protein